MEDKRRQSYAGIASIILGVLGIAIHFSFNILLHFLLQITHLGVKLYILWILISVFLGIIAMITARTAIKQGDTYGKYGMIFGIIVIVLVFVFFIENYGIIIQLR
jgi:hypothetical protein